jgi:phosphodiesterase/alkaline phosphatase D-like protein
MPERLRLMIYTCGGGHDALSEGLPEGKISFLPSALRRRLLQRGLSFKPDALIANGDQIYWDLRAPLSIKRTPDSLRARIAGTFDRAQPVFGTPNEAVFRRATAPQIIPQYGALLRSTPAFFMQDDHDYFDNDEATDEIITFPPDHFMLALARATRQLYYPEYLPDPNRPLGLPGASAADRPPGVAEAFGTLRYGKLAEILLYDIRRTQTLSGPSAVFVDGTVENWLKSRMTDREMIHVVNIPSNPPGWSAGKWGEWYPDILGKDGKLTTDIAKPYWQSGWLKQHDRLMAEVAAMPGRIPLVISGDLHAIAEGRMMRCGALEFAKNPVVVILSGPLGTGDRGWPSAFRGIGASVPNHLQMEENLKPIEENGFIIADFTRESITIRYFRFNYHQQAADVIDTLEPFRVTELKRPS